MEKREFISRSPSETFDIGDRIGRQANRGEVYALYGELGSGKTHLVKGIARGMGVPDWEYVMSPSFAIMNLYEGTSVLCHVDLYRIEADEVHDLNLEEFLDTGIVVVEWADKGLPWNDNIEIQVEITGENERKIVMIKR
ncbi:MAG TPA: tRNA (adenosine(37)-N6)-threonylcarbamoyltransferase complex ATPase subunit type 1 TsaE [Syntrophorhabdaceae bacterium]|nr:tRNA (adenosine(37)-N6)-threonylcarbamoyltransferase complex ATPase subunit type 1 TsaE [Syntrophorhabdaceae bacterium]